MNSGYLPTLPQTNSANENVANKWFTHPVSLRVQINFAVFSKWRKSIQWLILMLMLATGQPSVASAIPIGNVTIPSGSFIINMGIVPQTIYNGLKPYGLIYQLLLIKCPVDWAINTSKTKDGADFTYNGVEYKGGTFIIEKQYRTPAVDALISTWTNPAGLYKVVGVTTTSPVTVPLYLTFWGVPRWTMDQQNGSIAVNFFNYASIPATAYGGSSSSGWKTPAMLDCCDDIFVMPHADPIWSTHGHLYDWISSTGNGNTTGCKSGIWLGCHAGSALMNMFDNTTVDGDPIDFTQQTNFLVDKTGPASGAGPYAPAPGNSLILWGSHSAGTPPYSYAYATEPIMQFMGTTDAAQQNGSEQIYIPVGGTAGWYTTTHVGIYDPDHPQRWNLSNNIEYRPAALAYGPGMGIAGNGKVMLEAAHNISGTGTANVAAQRAFFNYSFLVAWEKGVLPDLGGLPDTIYSGNNYGLGLTLYYNTPGGTYTLQSIAWESTCGGTFNTSSSNPTTFTAPVSATYQPCSITVTITDACGRMTFDNHQVVLAPCNLASTKVVTPPSCYGVSNGTIAIASTNWTSPYNWTWTRTNPAGGPISGTGTTITGLSAGTYSVTISTTSPSCTGVFTAQVTQPAQLTTSVAITNAACFGSSSGSVDLTVSGGTPAYTYSWNGGAYTTEDLVNVPAGNYTVTVTDSKGCTATKSATLGQPSAGLTAPGVVTNVTCFNGSNGAIDITATGGTSPFVYDWGGGITTEDRTGLAAGTYNVLVTDANGCTATNSFTITQPASLLLSVAITDPSCDATPPIFDGAINLTVAGGTTPYSYSWSDMPGSPDPEDRTGLGPGTYSVIVTDAKGCTATISAVLVAKSTDPLPPSGIIH